MALPSHEANVLAYQKKTVNDFFMRRSLIGVWLKGKKD
tara:strand:+ start:2932 stop:3045 length:114 start_codon:yes stop_codon:yes gene_type:complete